MSISISQVLKHSSKFSGVTLLSKIINVPKAIVVAMVLGPAELGLAGKVLLIINYANLINFGTASVAYREIPGLLAINRKEKAAFVQNVGISVDLLCSIFLFIGIIIISISKIHSLYGLLVFVAAIGFILAKIYSYYETMGLARSCFDLVARTRFYSTLIVPTLSIVSVYYLGVFTLIAVPIIGTVLGIFLLKKNKQLEYHFKCTAVEAKRMLRIGISLSAIGFLYNIFQGTIDQTIIAAYLSSEQLGLFIYALGYIVLVLEFLRDIGRVLSPLMWKEADSAPSALEGFQEIKKFAVFTALLAAVIMTFSQIGFVFLVNFFTVKYKHAQPIFFILSFLIFFESMVIYPHIILGSSRVNGQNKIVFGTGIGVALNIVLDIIVVKAGYGVVGIVLVTVLTKGLIALLLYFYSMKYITASAIAFFSFLRALCFPLLLSGIFSIAHMFLIKSSAYIIWGVVSFFAQIISWFLFLKIFYPNYLDIPKIQSLLRELIFLPFGKYFVKSRAN